MNRSQQRAWAALGIGPRWVARAATEPAAEARSGVPDLPVPGPEVAPPRPAVPVIDAAPATPSMPPVASGLFRQGAETALVTMPSDDVATLDLQGLRERVARCRDCRLCETRTQTVFGVGDEQPHWMVVGEAPGAEEDRQGEPFVGQAGKLLDAMLASVGLSRQRGVFIANVLKCRPPGNRNPQPDEVASCSPFLHRQIALLRPRLLLVTGRFAAQTLLQTSASIGSLRGRVHRYTRGGLDLPVVVTYHPAYLLRDRHEDKARCWQDLCLARATAGPPD